MLLYVSYTGLVQAVQYEQGAYGLMAQPRPGDFARSALGPQRYKLAGTNKKILGLVVIGRYSCQRGPRPSQPSKRI